MMIISMVACFMCIPPFSGNVTGIGEQNPAAGSVFAG